MPTFPQIAGVRPGPGGSSVAFNISTPTQVKAGYGTVFRVYVNTAPTAAGGVYDVTTGTTATAVATINATGVVTGATVFNSGSAYTAAPTVTFSAPSSGTTATGTATIDTASGVVTGITITNPGSGYTAPPTVTLSAPTGGGTAGVANLISVIPTTAGPLEIVAPFYKGLYINPGTGGNVAVSYGL